MHTRYLKYKNCYGVELFFDNITFLCESMEISKATARYTSQIPLQSSGQVTGDYYCSSLPMRFSCALRDTKDLITNRQLVDRVFSPLAPGELTILTDEGDFKITAHQTARPEFVRAGSHAYRFELEFIADDPFWRFGEEKSIALNNGSTVVNNLSSVAVPFKVKVTAAGHVVNATIGKGFSFGAPPSGVPYYVINTEDYSVTGSNGANLNYLLDPTYLDNAALLPGENTLQTSTSGLVVYWQTLRGLII